MKIVILAHPEFGGSQSMPRYAHFLSDGLQKRGHQVEIWSPQPRFFKLALHASFRKWLGYIDQFLLFPLSVKRRLQHCTPDTLFVVADHALGPWVGLLDNRVCVIHCHDFLAQRSALGQIPENKIGWSGRIYQRFIRNGYRKGSHFISISNKTKFDLELFLLSAPRLSEVVYNGLNQKFTVLEAAPIRNYLGEMFDGDFSGGYVLHVGGNSFYKNRTGVIEIYDAWRSTTTRVLPLLMVGIRADDELRERYEQSPYKSDIYWLENASDEQLRMSYGGATVLLFPSLAEGFGWPIAEAMASGCPVITTGVSPMTEVGGEAALYITRRPTDRQQTAAWARESALTLEKVVTLSPDDRQKLIDCSLSNAERFEPGKAIAQMEEIYNRLMNSYQQGKSGTDK